jgi:hypothetical protein
MVNLFLNLQFCLYKYKSNIYEQKTPRVKAYGIHDIYKKDSAEEEGRAGVCVARRKVELSVFRDFLFAQKTDPLTIRKKLKWQLLLD